MKDQSHVLALRLRFRDLRLLVALADGSSLRKAAGILNVTQPALSRTLAEIEDTFGYSLFERSARGLQPTAQGLTAIRGARQLLRELDRVSEEVADSEHQASVIRVGAPPFVSHGLLPELVSRMQREGHRVRLKLVEAAVNDLFDSLVRGDVDALITTYTDRIIEDAQLTYESLFPSRYILLAPLEFEWDANKKRLPSLAHFTEMPWIMPGHTSMLRKDINKAFLAAGVEPPRPVVESTHPFTTIHFVAAGCGLGFVPVETLRSIKPDLVKEITLEQPLPTGPVALIYLKKLHNNAQLELLRQAIGLDMEPQQGGGGRNSDKPTNGALGV